jgi:hypothetical protein
MLMLICTYRKFVYLPVDLLELKIRRQSDVRDLFIEQKGAAQHNLMPFNDANRVEQTKQARD